MASFQPLPDVSEALTANGNGRAQPVWYRFWSDLYKRVSGLAALQSLAVFDTVTDAEAALIDDAATTVRTLGYASVGDRGGANYVRVDAEPAHDAWFQSSDGAYWELNEVFLTIQMFGGLSGQGSSFNVTPALDAFKGFCADKGYQELYAPSGVYYLNTAPDSLESGEQLAIRGDGVNSTVFIRNYTEADNTVGVFDIFGASGCKLSGFALNIASGTTGGSGIRVRATSSSGSSGQVFEDISIAPLGTDCVRQAIYWDGTAKTTGATGSRDNAVRGVTLFGASQAILVLSGCQGLAWHGGGIYPAGGTGAYGLQLTGTAGVVSNSVNLNLDTLQETILISNATSCRITTTVIDGDVENAASAVNCLVDSRVTGTVQANWTTSYHRNIDE